MATKNAVGNSLTGSTGTGTFVGATSPTLVTPALGTPASGNLSNCTSAVMAVGTMLQTLSTCLTTSFTVSSTGGASPWQDITGLSQAITPASSSNKILITVSMCAAGSSSTIPVSFQIVRTATAVGVGTTVSSRTAVGGGIITSQTYGIDSCVLQFLDSPATTSATTYKIQVANVSNGGAQTMYINRSVTDTDSNLFPRGVSTITLQEVKG